MRLGDKVAFTLTGMRVIEHPFALFFMGVDIMCGGQAEPSWNYEGVTVRTVNGKVSGSVYFCNEDLTKAIPLV